MTFPDFQG